MPQVLKSLADLAALSQVVIALVLIVALLYAAGQFREMAKARKLEATREIISQLGTEELRKDRTLLLHGSPMPEEKERIRRVAVAYDRVGYMVSQGLVSEKALFEFQQDEIEQLWKIAKPVIEQIQKTRRNYCKHFKDLAEKWLPEARKRFGS